MLRFIKVVAAGNKECLISIDSIDRVIDLRCEGYFTKFKIICKDGDAHRDVLVYAPDYVGSLDKMLELLNK